MSTKPELLETLLMLLLLGSGSGSYALLSAFSRLPHSANLLIATSLRLASIVFYRFYSQIRVTLNSPMRLFFEWAVPVVVVAEQIFTICAYPIDALCVQSNPWTQIVIILFVLDIFTFFLLASLLDSRTRLGPYGAFHVSIIKGCTTLATTLKTTFSEPAPVNLNDPSTPVTSGPSGIPIVDSISPGDQYPPPYSTYDSHYSPSKYGPILEMV